MFLGTHHGPDKRWHHAKACLAGAFVYYLFLRWSLKINPILRKKLKRCRHCTIYFLTQACNQNRSDLLCPMGCSVSHNKKASIERSTDYQKSPEGKIKKKDQNKKRRKKTNTNIALPTEKNREGTDQITKPRTISYLCFIFKIVAESYVSHMEMREKVQAYLYEMRQRGLGNWFNQMINPDD